MADIKVFADGAALQGILEMYRSGTVQGFTTNPSLMKQGGVDNYRAFAFEVLENIRDLPVSFEVFADDFEGMLAEAREIASWADNVYVKIPAMTTGGVSTKEIVKTLSGEGIKINVTTVFTRAQVEDFIDAVSPDVPSIISIFAGRIADTGVDPLPLMREAVRLAKAKPLCEILWASTRELLNIFQAQDAGVPIITVTNSILAKRKNVGKDLLEYSRDTVCGFSRDIATLGFSILPEKEEC